VIGQVLRSYENIQNTIIQRINIFVMIPSITSVEVNPLILKKGKPGNYINTINYYPL